jgi:hypothetical protein
MTRRNILSLIAPAAIPSQVLMACSIDWGVTVDAYLMGAARIGDRYAAEAYLDSSGKIKDGMTVITPDVTHVTSKAGFVMVRSLSQKDHYVIVTENPQGRTQ